MRMSLCMIAWQEEKALARCMERRSDAIEQIVRVELVSTE